MTCFIRNKAKYTELFCLVGKWIRHNNWREADLSLLNQKLVDWLHYTSYVYSQFPAQWAFITRSRLGKHWHNIYIYIICVQTTKVPLLRMYVWLNQDVRWPLGCVCMWGGWCVCMWGGWAGTGGRCIHVYYIKYILSCHTQNLDSIEQHKLVNYANVC